MLYSICSMELWYMAVWQYVRLQHLEVFKIKMFGTRQIYIKNVEFISHEDKKLLR